MYLLGREERMSPGREKTGAERLVEWDTLNAGYVQEARSPECVFLRVSRVSGVGNGN